MNKKNKSLFCIIVPMYNEENNAERCINKIIEYIKGNNLDSKLIIVDDGSKDNTNLILQRMSSKFSNLIVEVHKNNKGYGAANITGAKRAYDEGFEYALFMDADLTQDVKYIDPFIKYMNESIDFIKATRYAKGGKTKGVPLKRWIVSKIGNLLAKFLLRLPITDYTNGFRAVKTSILHKINCEERGFAYLVEEVNKSSKFAKSYAEVPYTLTVRENDFSKSKFNFSLSTYLKYLRRLLIK